MFSCCHLYPISISLSILSISSITAVSSQPIMLLHFGMHVACFCMFVPSVWRFAEHIGEKNEERGSGSDCLDER